ncbi:MAG: BBP7 family outer membrane beta-barrel protein [Planctomycetes bacterium]|nr:BBP7 family outer membrane beta-barrel protein [Planctomycetota bacterium]
MNAKGILAIACTLLAASGALTAQEPMPVMEAPDRPNIFGGLINSPNSPRLWFNTEYLAWWTQRQSVPVPILSTGNLDVPGTSVLLGNGAPFNSELHHGGRFTIGAALDSEGRFGIEGSYFYLAQRTDSTQITSSGLPGSNVLGYPVAFTNPAGGTTEGLVGVALPGVFSGLTTLSMVTQMQGGELNGLMNLRSTPNCRIDILGGGRYLNLRENLTMQSYAQGLPPAGAFSGGVHEDFATRNQFFGGQLGARFEVTHGRFFVNGTGKVAAGSVNQAVDVFGSLRQTSPTTDQTFAGGVYTQPSNLGRQSRNTFAWMPEVSLNAGMNLCDRVRVFAGYNFMWISNVVRPGDQIDRTLNASQLFGGTLVGTARPAVPFNDTSFWAQGITFGLQVRY